FFMPKPLSYPLRSSELISSHWGILEDTGNGRPGRGSNAIAERIREQVLEDIQENMLSDIDEEDIDTNIHVFRLSSSTPSKPPSTRGMSASATGGHIPSSPPVTSNARVEEPIRETIEFTPETSQSPDVSPTLRFSKLVPSRHALRAPSHAESAEEESDNEELIIEDSVEEDSSDVDSSDSEEYSSEDESSEEASSESEGDLVEGDELPSWINRSPSIELSLSPKAKQSAPHEPSLSPKAEPSSSSEPPSSIENSSDPAAMVPPSDSSSVEPSSPAPFNYAEHAVLGDEDDVKIYSMCLEKYLDEMDDDHEALTEVWLAKARIYQRPTLFPRAQNKFPTRNRAANKPRTDPFANIKHPKNARTITLTGKAFSQFKPRGETITSSGRISSTNAVSTEVPNYTHYTRISGNVLGTNTRQLQVWPYFGEDVDDDGTIRERFDVIVEDRPRKVLISQQVGTYGPYFEAFLEEIDCPMDTILKYLLEASEGPDGLLSRLTSFAYDAKFARTIIRAKDKYCRDDFDRTSQRWVSVASSLPEIDDQTLWKAAVVCHTFWIRTNFSPWQIARKYAKFPDNNKIEGLVTYEAAKNYASVACSICQLHDCPFHGTILERPDAKELSDEEDDANSVDALDVDYPPRVNFKELATAPLEREPPANVVPSFRATTLDHRARMRVVHASKQESVARRPAGARRTVADASKDALALDEQDAAPRMSPANVSE
ncbi:SET domain-containing protein, partial [Aureobasidium melanogenum]